MNIFMTCKRLWLLLSPPSSRGYSSWWKICSKYSASHCYDCLRYIWYVNGGCGHTDIIFFLQTLFIVYYPIDMDMSNGLRVCKIWRVSMRVRVRSDVHFHSHKWRHVAAAMHANNVLRNSYNTRPLLCARTAVGMSFFSISLTVQSVTSLTALLHS
jgi:hypothetical protein